jgi:hypothetical protein
VFSPAFVTKGAFELFFNGMGSEDIRAMPLSKMGRKILLARCDDVSVKTSMLSAGLVNSTVRMTFRILDAADGRVLDAFQLTAVGPGADREEAKKTALDRLMEQVSKRSF